MNKVKVIFLALILMSCRLVDNTIQSARGGSSTENQSNLVTFSTSAQSVSETAGIITVPIVLSKALTSNLSIQYSLSGTATENSDYTLSSSKPLHLLTGEQGMEIQILINDDTEIENSETLVITLSLFEAAANQSVELGAVFQHTLTIIDNDLVVKPSAGYLIPNESLSLTVTGGSGGYTYSMVGSPASTINASGVVTAASSAETFTIRVSDSSGQSKDVDYEVIDPKSDTSLKVWFKASELGLNDGDPVTTWNDLTGNGNSVTQTTTSQKPQYVANGLNSKPVVKFDGSNDYLYSNYTPPLGADPRSITFVISGMEKKEYSSVFAWGGTSSYGAMFGFTVFSASIRRRYVSTFEIDTHSWSSTGGVPPYSPLITDPYILTVQFTGTARKYFINGEPYYSVNAGVNTLSGAKLWVGARPGVSGGKYYYKGQLAELFLHESALSDTDRIKLECYLSRTYNIPLIDSVNCGVEQLKWRYRGSIALQTNGNKTLEAFGGMPPLTYSVVSGSGSVDSSTGLFTAPATEGTTVVQVKDRLGQTLNLTIDVVSIPVPLSWMNLSKGATGYSDGDRVMDVRDISGNENHYAQVLSTSSPVYRENSLNSQPVLEFSGAEFLSGVFPIPNSTNPRSFAFVAQNTVSGAFLAYGGESLCGQIFQVFASTTIKVERNCGAYNSSATVTTAAKLYVVTYGSGVMNIYENGVSVFSGGASFDTNSSMALKIGSDFEGLSTFLIGDIAELLVYDTVLSGADRAVVESYLMTKFGL